MISVTTNHSEPISCGEFSEDTDEATLTAVKLFKNAKTKISKVAELRISP